MKNMLIQAAVSFLLQLPWDRIVEIVKQLITVKVNPILIAQIERLVRAVDAMDLPGEEKFKWVLDALVSSDSPVRKMVEETPDDLVDMAIQTAVVRLRALKG
jgi:hypothetical protein